MKNSSINKILDEHVLNVLILELKSSGFKLKKSASTIELEKEGISLIILIYRRDYLFIWDEQTDEAFLTFRIFSRLKFVKYNEWFRDKFQKEVETEKFLRKDFLYLKLDKTLYGKDDFSENSGTPVIVESDFEKKRCHKYETETHQKFDKAYIESIKELGSTLDSKIDLGFINERQNLPLEYVMLPHFYDQEEMAVELLNQHFNMRINYINDKIAKGQSQVQVNTYMENLKIFIAQSKEHLGVEYQNPFEA